MSAVMSAVPFAALEQRVNRVALERASNGRAVIGQQATVTLPVVFNRTPAMARAGDVSIRSRDVTVTCLTEYLDKVPVAQGTPVTVYYHGQLHEPAGTYKVAAGGRVDHHESGTTLLELEQA